MSQSQKEFFAAAIVVIIATLGICSARLSREPEIISSGAFHQVAHKGAGKAFVLRKPNGQIVVRLADFSTAEKPDLYVYLISAPDALENETVKHSEVFSLGKLKTAAGDQEYPLPDDLDVSRFHAVTVWSRKYSVNYTTAPLRRH